MPVKIACGHSERPSGLSNVKKTVWRGFLTNIWSRGTEARECGRPDYFDIAEQSRQFLRRYRRRHVQRVL
jgi:hypothetical protein